MARSWIGILVAVTASVIIVLMVAGGGVIAGEDASAETLTDSPTTGVPDALTICHEVNNRITCVREAT